MVYWDEQGNTVEISKADQLWLDDGYFKTQQAHLPPDAPRAALSYRVSTKGQVDHNDIPKVREQTQLEDLEVIEKYRKSVVSPNAKNSPEVVKIANTLLGRAREKLQQSAEKILKKVQAVLLKPEVKQAGKEQIKKKARESIKEKLAKGKLDADRKNRERWEREGRIAPTKKQDMEL